MTDSNHEFFEILGRNRRPSAWHARRAGSFKGRQQRSANQPPSFAPEGSSHGRMLQVAVLASKCNSTLPASS